MARQEMAPVYLNSVESMDKENLLTKHSFSSFVGRDNEITFTRSFGDRKYSMMSFKKSAEENKTIDIVVTQGEYQDKREKIMLQDFTSQDIRQKYSVKAKLGAGIVFFLLFAMISLIVVALLLGQKNHVSTQGPRDGVIELTLNGTESGPTVVEVMSSTLRTLLKTNTDVAEGNNITKVTGYK